MTSPRFSDYFVVISDIHMRDSSMYKNANSSDYLHRVLLSINKYFIKARACLLLGDIADSGSDSSYQSVRDQLQSLTMPIYATVGNHDNRAIMQSHFAASYNSDGFAQSAHSLAADWRLLVLDSKLKGQAQGEICPTRLAWLQAQLQTCSERNIIIAMHHPPGPLAVPALDHIALGDGKALLEVLKPHKDRIRMLLCSHFHLSISANWHGFSVCVVPALSHDHWQGTRSNPAFALVAFNIGSNVAAHSIVC